MFFLASALDGLVANPFANNIIIPSAILIVVLVLILGQIVKSFGFRLW